MADYGLVNKIICADVMGGLKMLPDNSVHCVITSPPYYGLRDYRIEGQIGLEKTPEEYIEKMVEVFRGVRRVLHPSGTLWLNFGDSYFTSAPGNAGKHGTGKIGDGLYKRKWDRQLGHGETKEIWKRFEGYKSKNLLMMPFRVAMALQKDGWYLRSVMPWVKRNSMPESVTDRPSTSLEYVFLMAKNQKYFWDAEAIKIKSIRGGEIPKGNKHGRGEFGVNAGWAGGEVPPSRNFRNSDFFFQSWQGLWVEGEAAAFIVNPKGFKEAHFATFPEKLVEPCVKAGTSEKGCCPDCGEPWIREIERGKPIPTGHGGNKRYTEHIRIGRGEKSTEKSVMTTGAISPIKTLGWKQNCKCEPKEPIPAICLDPFMGSGTVAVVAKKLGRNYIGIELNPKYVEMAEERIKREVPDNLFNNDKGREKS